MRAIRYKAIPFALQVCKGIGVSQSAMRAIRYKVGLGDLGRMNRNKSQSAMRAIRYKDGVQIGDLLWDRLSQSAMRAIRYKGRVADDGC